MSTKPGIPTLDQLTVFLHVVDTGSFTGAARKLNRALSAISYTIGNLEGQLGVTLFERQGSKRPVLTTAGRAVLGEARSISANVDALRSKVAGLGRGLEGELHVALDSLLPPARVVEALEAFRKQFPTVSLQLHVETLGAIAHLVREGKASIGVAGPYADYPELVRLGCGSFRMGPVAGRNHPLAAGARPLAPGAGRGHVQLVVYDRSPLTTGRDFSVEAGQTWRLADLSTKHMLLRAGIGWGMMPLDVVQDDLASGVLVQLQLPDWPSFDYPVDAVYRRDAPPGPAGLWLLRRFQQQESGCPTPAVPDDSSRPSASVVWLRARRA